jgi:hypothetical protein
LFTPITVFGRKKEHKAQFLKLKQPSLSITQPDNNQVGLHTCNIISIYQKLKTSQNEYFHYHYRHHYINDIYPSFCLGCFQAKKKVEEKTNAFSGQHSAMSVVLCFSRWLNNVKPH